MYGHYIITFYDGNHIRMLSFTHIYTHACMHTRTHSILTEAILSYIISITRS